MTGGTGFLGSHLLKTLIKSGKTIHCLRRSSSSYGRIDNEMNSVIKWVDLEDCNFDQYFEQNDIRYVLHCATNYGRGQNNPTEIVEANLILPLKLLHAVSQNQVKAFVNTDTILDKGIGSYSLSKKQFTEWLQSYSNKITCINIALEHFYGPHDDPSKFVTYILRALLENKSSIDLTEGRQKRDFVYIDDVVSAILALINNMDNLENGYHHFEVGSGSSIEIREFVALSKKLTGNTKTQFNFGAVPYRKNEVMDTRANIDKLLSLGWRPQYNLESGLVNTISQEKNGL
jgi:nucleoside-diphosphate-sugar epimerase